MCLTNTFNVNLVAFLWQGWWTSDGLVTLWRSWLEQPMIAELAGVNCYHIRTWWWFIHSVHKIWTSFFTENLRKKKSMKINFFFSYMTEKKNPYTYWMENNSCHFTQIVSMRKWIISILYPCNCMESSIQVGLNTKIQSWMLWN